MTQSLSSGNPLASMLTSSGDDFTGAFRGYDQQLVLDRFHPYGNGPSFITQPPPEIVFPSNIEIIRNNHDSILRPSADRLHIGQTSNSSHPMKVHGWDVAATGLHLAVTHSYPASSATRQLVSVIQ